MTNPSLVGPAPTAVWDPVGTKLEDLVRGAAIACLLEDPHGRIVCHALSEGAPEVAVQAVLARSAGPLHRASTHLRVAGRLTSGPLLSGSLGEWRGAVVVVPLAGAGHLWVFGEQPLGFAAAEAIAGDLAGVLHQLQGQATEPGVLERLHGLGANVAALDTWVVVLREHQRRGWEPLALHRALSAAFTGCAGLEVTVTHTHAFVLLRGAPEEAARRRVDEALDRMAPLLALTVVAALAPATTGLDRAREAAERALSALAVPGRCVTVEQARSYETLHRVLDAVREIPVQGGDPLADLVDAGEPFVVALRAWLDAHGVVPVAASRLGVHTNTLRYRIKRAVSLVPADLDDPVARLEIHLRLLALTG